MQTISVHGSPSEYILKKGILSELEAKLEERGCKKVLLVHGARSIKAAEPYLPELISIEETRYLYGGECTFEEVDKVANLVKEGQYDAVIGIGGGKVLDLVKAVCHHAGKQAVLIPTLASNCAPWTPLSVLYDEKGAFIRYDIYPVSTSLVLVEPEILVHAPVELFVAGIGDTLAKWYEADVQLSQLEYKPVALEIAHEMARRCRDILLADAKNALEAADRKEVNDAFIRTAEAIIVLGGMVGGFGDHYGRISGAHSVHNGLTVLEETHGALHGDKVAYGILVQLALEGKEDEMQSLLPFYGELGLPYRLEQLGAASLDEKRILLVAEKAAAAGESIHNMPVGEITPARVAEAIGSVERIGSAFRETVKI